MDQFREVVGGAQTYQRTLLPELQRRGHELALLHERALHPNKGSLDELCSNVDSICSDALGVTGAARRAVAWKPDIVYAQGVASVELEAMLLGQFPSALYAHNYIGTCATGTKCHTRPAPEACTRRLGPMCLPLNYTRGCGARNPIRLLSIYRDQKERQRLLGKYRFIAVASQHMKREFERHDVASERLHVLPYVPAPVFASLASPGAPPMTGRVLFVGRLTSNKGGVELVQAMHHAKGQLGRPLVLVVVGDGPARPHIEAAAAALGVSLECTGWKTQAEVRNLMMGADLLAMPSVWPEPFGLLGVEAGRLGLPSVAFATGGIPDWLIPGVTGELAPGERPSAEELAAAIVRALADSTHLARLREGAWRGAALRTLSGHADAVESLLLGVAALS